MILYIFKHTQENIKAFVNINMDSIIIEYKKRGYYTECFFEFFQGLFNLKANIA